MPEEPIFEEITFFADKVYMHHWPFSSPTWSNDRQKNIDKNINKNLTKKQITIRNKIIKIDSYSFILVKKIGLTIPQFKRQATMIFEGHCEEFDAHVHVTTKAENYLEIFNKLMMWRDAYFPDTPYS